MKESIFNQWNNIKAELSFLKSLTKELLTPAESKEPAWGDCSQRTWGDWKINN